MKDLIYLDKQDLKKGKVLTNSLIIAKEFDKPHNDLLKIIREVIIEAKEIGLGNFSQCSYTNENNREMPMYVMDRDAFMFLVMHLNGKKANIVKARFIKAFNQMEQELIRRKEVQMIGRTIRKEFTDTIKIFNCGEDNDFIKWSYKLFTDEVYKLALGGTCKQLRIARNQFKIKNFRDTLTSEELSKVQYWEEFIKQLAIEKGWIKLPNKEIYKKVKEWLENEKNK